MKYDLIQRQEFKNLIGGKPRNTKKMDKFDPNTEWRYDPREHEFTGYINIDCPEEKSFLEIHRIRFTTPRAGLLFRCFLRGLNNTKTEIGSPRITKVNSGEIVFDPPYKTIDENEQFVITVERYGKGPTNADIEVFYNVIPNNGLERAAKQAIRQTK